PVALTAGPYARPLDAAAHVSAVPISLAIEDELGEAAGEPLHGLVFAPGLDTGEVKVYGRGQHVPVVDGGQEVLLLAAHGEDAPGRHERDAAVGLHLAEVLVRDLAQLRRFLRIGVFARQQVHVVVIANELQRLVDMGPYDEGHPRPWRLVPLTPLGFEV